MKEGEGRGDAPFTTLIIAAAVASLLHYLHRNWVAEEEPSMPFTGITDHSHITAPAQRKEGGGHPIKHPNTTGHQTK